MERTSTDERYSVQVETREARRSAFLAWLDAVVRRALDIVGAAVGMMLLAPSFVMIALAIRADSPGPVFYRGRRAGKGGKEFRILKFRTMYDGENCANGAKVTAADDPRVTPTGRWLRDTKVNELPQLWNVLVGDMSLVGPRPEDPDIVATWPEEYRKLLLSVKPGITSPATVMYRDEENLLSTADVMDDYLKDIMPTKMRLEKLYVRNRSIITDLDVIFWTAISLLPSIRTIEVPQQYLYWGPISRITFRYLSWLVIDTVIAFLAVGAAGVIWRISGPLDVGWGRSILYALGISAFFSLTNWVLRLNRLEWSRAPARNVLKLGFSTGLATGILIAFDFLINVPQHLPVAMIIFSGVLALMGFTVVRYRERLVTRTGTQWLKARGGVRSMGERVLIVGGGENGCLASWIFENTAMGKAIKVVGIVDDDPRMQGLRIDGYDVLGMTNAIPELVQKHDIGLILFTIDNIAATQRARILSLCHQTGVKVVVLPDILETLRKELKIIRTPENETKVAQNDPARLLDEIQSLLVEYKVEEAQACITEFRQRYHNNHP